MNRILPVAALFFAAAPRLFGAVSSPDASLREGAEMRTDALRAAEWIRGTAPEQWEPGKVYLLDCWATWCGPCLSAVPHLNALHRKLEAEGLRVIGVSVWEDDPEKVRAYVEGRGQEMLFPVAFAGRHGRFVREWLTALGVVSIPRAFVVKDGRLLLATDPLLLDETAVRGLLEGGEPERRAIASVRAGEATQARLSAALKEFRSAASARRPEEMEAALAAVAGADATGTHVPGLRLEAALVSSDWPGAAKCLERLPEGPAAPAALADAGRRLATASDAPESLVAAVRDRLAPAADSPDAFLSLARLRWRTGERAGAVEAAHLGARLADDIPGSKGGPESPYRKFAEALEVGTLPDEAELKAWFRPRPPTPTVETGGGEPGNEAGDAFSGPG